MDDCVRERFLVVDDFLPDDQARAMRVGIDHHFSNPGQHTPATHQVWNYWHVPGSYTYLRTTPEKVIAQSDVEQFVECLRFWAGRNLGLSAVTWPYLSLYVPGCEQGLHNDSTNGRLGYVFSLTRHDRKTIGGDTVVVHDRDLFRTSLDRPAAGTGLLDLVEPRFNRLTLFDDRIPHAVRRIDGSMDPLEGRFVLHGHISEAGVVLIEGPLQPEAIANAATEAVNDIRSWIAPEVRGPFVAQVEIGPAGDVADLRPILDRLASPDGASLDQLSIEIVERLKAVRFPGADFPTRANIPLIF